MKKRPAPTEGLIIERGVDSLHIYCKGGEQMPVLRIIINDNEYVLPRYGSIALDALPGLYRWAVFMRPGEKIPVMGDQDIKAVLDTFFNH